MSYQFIFTLGLCACLISCTSQKMEFHKNKVIAHRGAWKANPYPQNSLASLQAAIELGCEGSEFDVWMTADGVLVANHDADHEEMVIEEVTYAQLLEKPLANGEKVPTVEEYLKHGMKQSKTKLIFEIKPSGVSKAKGIELAEKSVAIVKELGAEQWVDYITFDYDIALKVIELDPNANVAYLRGDKTPQELKDDGFFGFDYNIKKVKENPHWIKEAQDLNMTVNVWTVNNEEDMKWLLDQDVDFITTDEPEKLFSIIK
ncbi:Glycerophosphoryl diester phosphodiesterase [Cyclobacterium amurskyense]|jgi:glycerophosphoryl diester phosphodiesterase|uniref:Glycerophosphoryl diester phosphodiesterase n=2 Tax=Cyclobacterium amurskyense TaxID=320787 RepID=A0A0H4PLL9_9BACT|nr:Glycerophosphoryl diester phosphodiesterase [Cyclobacterium amurskyense]|tara:strand:+ start:9576 stop:10352 length:777 start_codon:yes stop_codon:yes gene_type:complete